MTHGGGPQAVYRPGEAGRAIGVKPSTLRVYAQRFADLLSEDAAGPEREGYRFYTARDVEVLKKARELLDRGFTYERAQAELAAAGYGARPTPPSRRARSGRAEAAPVELGAQVAVLQQAVEAWRALAEERGAEIAQLREEIRQLREMVLGGRRLAPVARVRHR